MQLPDLETVARLADHALAGWLVWHNRHSLRGALVELAARVVRLERTVFGTVPPPPAIPEQKG